MGKQTSLEVRISPEAKTAVHDRAEAQGYTVSEGVRRLLALWVAGVIDLAAIERLEVLPKMDELQALAQALEKARATVDALGGRLEDAITDLEAAAEPVTSFAYRYGDFLEGRDAEPNAPLEVWPDTLQRLILEGRRRG